MSDKVKLWLVNAGIRAIRTVAQTAVATIGAAVVFSEVNWAMVGSAALLAGILSLLMSISGIPEVEDGATLGQLMKDDE